jgi:hypothetical protein
MDLAIHKKEGREQVAESKKVKKSKSATKKFETLKTSLETDGINPCSVLPIQCAFDTETESEYPCTPFDSPSKS